MSLRPNWAISKANRASLRPNKVRPVEFDAQLGDIKDNRACLRLNNAESV